MSDVSRLTSHVSRLSSDPDAVRGARLRVLERGLDLREEILRPEHLGMRERDHACRQPRYRVGAEIGKGVAGQELGQPPPQTPAPPPAGTGGARGGGEGGDWGG